MSRIKLYPVNRLVLSSFGFFARNRGGELPGAWFVRAFHWLRLKEAAVRQTLHRMERNGELESSRLGRNKLYYPSIPTWAAIDAGTERLCGSVDIAWDGNWTLIHFPVSHDQPVARERIRTLLETEGYGRLARGVYIHPRDRTDRVLAAVSEAGTSLALTVIRGRRLCNRSDAALVAELWDIRTLAMNYRRFLRRYEPIANQLDRIAPPDAFALRFVIILDFLQTAWGDPSVPDLLLPRDWPGTAAHRLTHLLNSQLLPLAQSFGDTIMNEILHKCGTLDAHFRKSLHWSTECPT